MMEGSKVRQESGPGDRKKGATLWSLGEELEEEVTNPSKSGRSTQGCVQEQISIAHPCPTTFTLLSLALPLLLSVHGSGPSSHQFQLPLSASQLWDPRTLWFSPS